jgi:hypothetical protein
MALLSADCLDRSRGALRIRPDGHLPILAAAPRIEKPRATVEIRVHQDGQSETVVKDEAETRTGRFTTIWEQIRLPDEILHSGMTGEVVLELQDGTGAIIASICHSLRRSLPKGGGPDYE